VGYEHAQDVDGQELTSAILQVRAKADAAYSQGTGYITSTGTTVTLPELFTYDAQLPLGITNAATGTNTPTAAQLGNEWGGSFTVGVQSSTPSSLPACATTGAGPANDLLTITVSKIPAGVCTQLIATIAPQVYDTQVNGHLVALSPAPGNGVQGRSGVNFTKSGSFCTSAAAGNTLQFRSLKPLDFSTLRQNPMTTTMTAAESACVTPQYNRVTNAQVARENAQLAL
jgi:hypothetical protein